MPPMRIKGATLTKRGFYTPAVVMSSDLPDITIFTDHEFVDFRLLAGGYPLLQGRYYALNDTTVVSDKSATVASSV